MPREQTDGADTIYVNNITFRNWVVDNGDDSISLKANSTNVLIESCDFYTGLGFAIGSMMQVFPSGTSGLSEVSWDRARGSWSATARELETRIVINRRRRSGLLRETSPSSPQNRLKPMLLIDIYLPGSLAASRSLPV